MFKFKFPKSKSYISGSAMFKVLCLVSLTFQNVGLLILMRYSRTRLGDQYLMTTAVVSAEVFKLIACLFIICLQAGSIKDFFEQLNVNILKRPLDFLIISIPGCIYMIQNNLLYIALSNLDAATYQVIYQLKIITTALFSIWMLGRNLSKLQWFALVILFSGVSVIIHLQATNTNLNKQEDEHVQNVTLGIIAVLISCILSGFAGVFFEKILKQTSSTIFILNVQLAIFGIFTGLSAVYIFDHNEVSSKGFFHGYDYVVLFIILLQSLGGILVAVVVKYTDSILKGFATSAAIVISCLISILFFNFQLSFQFFIGTLLVISSVFIYSKFAYIAPRLP